MISTQLCTNPASLPKIGTADAAKKHLLTEADLQKLHLQAGAPPVAMSKTDDGVIYYFDPDKVIVAPAAPPRRDPGDPPKKMKLSAALKLGYYPKETLQKSFYEPTEAPVAFYLRNGAEIPLYDKATCRRLPLPCAKCGDPVRYRAKLCRTCFEEKLAQRRAEGDRRRQAEYHMDRADVLFFDLEMTGLYSHDEVLSLTFSDGYGRVVFDSLVRPLRNRSWKRTEEIHGITPEMVKDAPTLPELAPTLRGLLENAERLVAFGTSTDFFHLSRLYNDRKKRQILHDKIIDCGAEFSNYAYEHHIELSHHSLSDAMATLGLSWHGTAHTSAADTDACRMVFEALFPHYFKEDQ